MASNVKAWNVPIEDFLLRLIVTIGTLDPCLLTTPREVRISVAAPRLHQTRNQGQSPPVPLKDPATARRFARRLRNSLVPHVGSSKPSAHAPESGLVRNTARREGSLGQSRALRSSVWSSRAVPGAHPSP